MSQILSAAVVGGGQAGLSTSYYLKQNSIDHIVLDKGNIGDTWRLKRWDSFCLVTQNWQLQLPGFPYKGDDPEGFMPKNEVIDYLERYAESFGPPIKSGVTVNRIYYDESESLFMLDTTSGTYLARSVVIATGTYQHNRIPSCAGSLSADIVQLHTSEYKNPQSLPEGGVLVVGTGQSGCQVAQDLAYSGRRVYMSVGSAPRIPRRYRGKDILQWADLMALYDLPVDRHEQGTSIRFKSHPHITGRDGGQTIDLRKLALEGITLLGRLSDIEGTKIVLADDLLDNLDRADTADEKMKKTIDEFIEKNGIDAPYEEGVRHEWEPTKHIDEIDLTQENITSLIWATGYGYNFDWIELPVFDDRGYPRYERGITRIPGFYFIGLHWMHTWDSGLFYSVGRDAKHIVNDLIQRI